MRKHLPDRLIYAVVGALAVYVLASTIVPHTPDNSPYVVQTTGP
jgi:hypothetical protein